MLLLVACCKERGPLFLTNEYMRTGDQEDKESPNNYST